MERKDGGQTLMRAARCYAHVLADRLAHSDSERAMLEEALATAALGDLVGLREFVSGEWVIGEPPVPAAPTAVRRLPEAGLAEEGQPFVGPGLPTPAELLARLESTDAPLETLAELAEANRMPRLAPLHTWIRTGSDPSRSG